MSAVKNIFTGPEKVSTGSIRTAPFKLQDYGKNESFLNREKDKIAKRGLTQINGAPQAEFRAGQTSLASTLADQVAGRTPSVAEMQLNRGREDNIKAAMAMAGSQPGAAVSSGARGLANSIMSANRATNADSAVLRANEQNTATNTLANVLNQGRGADVGLATSQAQLTTQEMAQKDNMVRDYLAMGINLDQAQSLASQKLEELRLGIRMGNAQAANQASGGLLGGIATVGAAALSGGGK